MVDGTILWAEWNMNSVLGEVFITEPMWTFDTANFKIFFTWTKGNRRAACVEAIRSAREVIAAHSTTLRACRFIAICFT